MIKIFFVNTIKAIGQEVGKRITDKVRCSPNSQTRWLNSKGVSETAIEALLYTKFASLSAGLRPLLAELEHRVRTTPNELSALLGECHSAWVSTRQALLGNRVNNEVARMEPMTSDLVDLVRAIEASAKTCADVRRDLGAAISSRPAWMSLRCTRCSFCPESRSSSELLPAVPTAVADSKRVPGRLVRQPVRPYSPSNPTRAVTRNALRRLHSPAGAHGAGCQPGRRSR